LEALERAIYRVGLVENEALALLCFYSLLMGDSIAVFSTTNYFRARVTQHKAVSRVEALTSYRWNFNLNSRMHLSLYSSRILEDEHNSEFLYHRAYRSCLLSPLPLRNQ
jgi:hypothetical protein